MSFSRRASSIVSALVLFLATPGSAAAQDPDARAITLRPVETGVAAFVGVVPDDARGRSGSVAAAGRPIEVRGYGDFVTRFGEVTVAPGSWTAADGRAQRHLQEAVRGFFVSGGERAWVLRVRSASELTDPGVALRTLERVDVDLIAVPGAIGARQHEALLAHVETTGDRVALLDGRPDPARNVFEEVRATPRSSDRAILLFPWIRVADPGGSGAMLQPSSGHVAGALARGDRVNGVHGAPANLELSGAKAERSLSRAELGALNVSGVLALRPVSGTLRTWGGRTLGGEGAGPFRYVAIRRTVDQVEETLRESLGDLDCPEAEGAVRSLLDDMWRSGALQGVRSAEAYFVRCDSRTSVLTLGLALMRPSEFVPLAVEVGALP